MMGSMVPYVLRATWLLCTCMKGCQQVGMSQSSPNFGQGEWVCADTAATTGRRLADLQYKVDVGMLLRAIGNVIVDACSRRQRSLT